MSQIHMNAEMLRVQTNAELREELRYECALCDGVEPEDFIELFRRAIDLFPALPYVFEERTGISSADQSCWIKRTKHPLTPAFRRLALDLCVDILGAIVD